MHGKGEFRWTDGKIYKGFYVNNLKEGYGELVWPDGTFYRGFWKSGRMNGLGTYKG